MTVINQDRGPEDSRHIYGGQPDSQPDDPAPHRARHHHYNNSNITINSAADHRSRSPASLVASPFSCSTHTPPLSPGDSRSSLSPEPAASHLEASLRLKTDGDPATLSRSPADRATSQPPLSGHPDRQTQAALTSVHTWALPETLSNIDPATTQSFATTPAPAAHSPSRSEAVVSTLLNSLQAPIPACASGCHDEVWKRINLLIEAVGALDQEQQKNRQLTQQLVRPEQVVQLQVQALQLQWNERLQHQLQIAQQEKLLQQERQDKEQREQLDKQQQLLEKQQQLVEKQQRQLSEQSQHQQKLQDRLGLYDQQLQELRLHQQQLQEHLQQQPQQLQEQPQQLTTTTTTQPQEAIISQMQSAIESLRKDTLSIKHGLSKLRECTDANRRNITKLKSLADWTDPRQAASPTSCGAASAGGKGSHGRSSRSTGSMSVAPVNPLPTLQAATSVSPPVPAPLPASASLSTPSAMASPAAKTSAVPARPSSPKAIGPTPVPHESPSHMRLDSQSGRARTTSITAKHLLSSESVSSTTATSDMSPLSSESARHKSSSSAPKRQKPLPHPTPDPSLSFEGPRHHRPLAHVAPNSSLPEGTRNSHQTRPAPDSLSSDRPRYKPLVHPAPEPSSSKIAPRKTLSCHPSLESPPDPLPTLHPQPPSASSQPSRVQKRSPEAVLVSQQRKGNKVGDDLSGPEAKRVKTQPQVIEVYDDDDDDDDACESALSVSVLPDISSDNTSVDNDTMDNEVQDEDMNDMRLWTQQEMLRTSVREEKKEVTRLHREIRKNRDDSSNDTPPSSSSSTSWSPTGGPSSASLTRATCSISTATDKSTVITIMTSGDTMSAPTSTIDDAIAATMKDAPSRDTLPPKSATPAAARQVLFQDCPPFKPTTPAHKGVPSQESLLRESTNRRNRPLARRGSAMKPSMDRSHPAHQRP
ncbi:hypothetical protein DFQ26_009381 [Actinomortierella ambigua]|nr:hypothetical protein DFQ26_009381 [Actinomortierella ambigua]